MERELMAVASPIFAHLASDEFAELGRIFGRAILRHISQKELDAIGDSEAQCVSMKIEPNGTHACTAHASPTAREMTADERVDYAAESGERVRCARCEPQPRRRQEAKR